MKNTSLTMENDLYNEIFNKGHEIRQMKADKVSKDKVDMAVREMISLKSKYKALTGNEWLYVEPRA
jgi:hypothetical protein